MEIKLLLLVMIALFAVFMAVLAVGEFWGEEWTTASQNVAYFFIAFVVLAFIAFAVGQALRRG